MTKLYGSITNERQSTSTKRAMSELNAHIRSWDHGIYVAYKILSKTETLCQVYVTGGSNNPSKHKLLKEFKLGEISNLKPGIASQVIGNAVR